MIVGDGTNQLSRSSFVPVWIGRPYSEFDVVRGSWAITRLEEFIADVWKEAKSTRVHQSSVHVHIYTVMAVKILEGEVWNIRVVLEFESDFLESGE